MEPLEYFPELFHNHLMKIDYQVFYHFFFHLFEILVWMTFVPTFHSVVSSLHSCKQEGCSFFKSVVL